MGLGQPPFRAVKGVTLDIYEDQIFCLLGHNGAGKTTTINMLSGMLNISSGGGTILGKDIETEMADIRQSLGICPQHDVLCFLFPCCCDCVGCAHFQVLWNDLTVREHLEFFAALKGVPGDQVAAAAAQTLNEIGIPEKADFYPTGLSGGQKSLCGTVQCSL